jgi:phenylacetate-coenzyme A ligase PaaK-like adenylate-forming protein
MKVRPRWPTAALENMTQSAELVAPSDMTRDLHNALGDWLERPLYQRHAPTRGETALDQLPFVTKHDLRTNFPHNFIAPGEPTLDELLAANAAELEYTSGTSEERVPVLLPRGWWDAQEERALRLNSVVGRILDECPAPRRGTLTTPVCNGQQCPSKWMPRAQRTFGRTLFLNHARIPFLLPEEELAQMADDIAHWEPQLLDLDPVHGAWFALYCERKGIRFPSLRFILCSYEFVSVVHRRIIERVFGVPTLNLYGATESGHLLMESDNGEMLASRETAHFEIIEPDERGIGPLVVTSLSNHLMPLVRYRIGDLVSQREEVGQTLFCVHGRVRDALHAADGRRVTTWDVDQCFRDTTGLVHYQLRQDEHGRCALRYIPEDMNAAAPSLTEVCTRLQALLDQREPIAIERVDTIVPSQSGKFRLTQPA